MPKPTISVRPDSVVRALLIGFSVLGFLNFCVRHRTISRSSIRFAGIFLKPPRNEKYPDPLIYISAPSAGVGIINPAGNRQASIMLNAARFAVITLLSSVAPAHEVNPRHDTMRDRAEQMDRISDRSSGMTEKQCEDMLRNRMSMMQDQMADMHGMMSGHGGTMSGPGSGSGPDMQGRLGAMQERMDLMEQMVWQQQMMMDRDLH